MAEPSWEGNPVACAGAVIRRPDGRIVVIRRRYPPSEGLWSIPGGRVELGESRQQAAHREALEETGLDIEVGELLGRSLIPGLDAGSAYDVSDYAAEVVGDPDLLAAGDDATEARWVDEVEFLALPTVPGLAAALSDWGVWS